MKVLIGTNNKGKVEGAKQAFEKFYENVWFNKRSIYNGTNWIYKWRHLERLEILYSACPRLLLNSVQSGDGGKMLHKMKLQEDTFEKIKKEKIKWHTNQEI